MGMSYIAVLDTSDMYMQKQWSQQTIKLWFALLLTVECYNLEMKFAIYESMHTMFKSDHLALKRLDVFKGIDKIRRSCWNLVKIFEGFKM